MTEREYEMLQSRLIPTMTIGFNDSPSRYSYNKGYYNGMTEAKNIISKFFEENKKGERNMKSLNETTICKKKPFTKADLRSGDVVIKRMGNVEIVCRETNSLICSTSYNMLDNIRNDLSNRIDDNYDIVDVYRPKEPAHCCFLQMMYEKGEHVYHREEPPVEVTLEEIAELKGVPVERIKIVKESKNND